MGHTPGRMGLQKSCRLCRLALVAPLLALGLIPHVFRAPWLTGVGANASTGIYKTENSQYCRSHGVANSTGTSPYTIEIWIQGSVPYSYSGHPCGLDNDHLEHWCCETYKNDMLQRAIVWVVLEFIGTVQAWISLMSCLIWLLVCADSEWDDMSGHRYWLFDIVFCVSLGVWVVGHTSGGVGFLLSACDAVVSHNGVDTCKWGWPLVTLLVEVVMLWGGVLV